MQNLSKRRGKIKAKSVYRGLFVKLYINSLNDRKIRQMEPVERCFWMDCLMLAKPQRGVLPASSDISFALRMSEAEVKSLLMRLVARNLIDEDHMPGQTVWSIHQWDKWQSDEISTDRVRAFRERKKNSKIGDETVSETDETRFVTVSCNIGTNSNSKLSTCGEKTPIHEIGTVLTRTRNAGGR